MVGIHDRSIMGGNGEDYDYLLDDVNVIKYLLEHYNIDRDRIIIHGNSRSTMAASTIIRHWRTALLRRTGCGRLG